jgi:hypothetical protein
MTLVFFEMTHVTAGFATQELLNKKVKEKEHKPRLPKTVFAPTLPIISHSMEIIYKRNTCDCSLLSLDHQQVKLHILYLVHTSLYATHPKLNCLWRRTPLSNQSAPFEGCVHLKR